MKVTYPVLAEEPTEFKRDFEHLFYRICQLERSLAGFHETGNVFSLTRTNSKAYDAPHIVEVSFEKERALVYERRAENFFTKISQKREICVPYPKFAVTLKLDFGFGVREERVYDYKKHCDETLYAFCEEACNRARDVFRHNFSPMRIPVK